MGFLQDLIEESKRQREEQIKTIYFNNLLKLDSKTIFKIRITDADNMELVEANNTEYLVAKTVFQESINELGYFKGMRAFLLLPRFSWVKAMGKAVNCSGKNIETFVDGKNFSMDVWFQRLNKYEIRICSLVVHNNDSSKSLVVL